MRNVIEKYHNYTSRFWYFIFAIFVKITNKILGFSYSLYVKHKQLEISLHVQEEMNSHANKQDERNKPRGRRTARR